MIELRLESVPKMELVRLAERDFASYLGVKHALMTSRGRTALVVALRALGVGLGDDVILPSFSCDILAKCVEFCRARPIFADVDPRTFNVNPQEIKSSITRNTKAIIVIHCYGQPADMDEILEIAKQNNVSVIEDVAHALGAEYHGQKVGKLGDISFFSFSKNMGCSIGGALVTNCNDLMSKAEKLLEDFSSAENTIGRLKYSMKRKFLGLGTKKRSVLSSLGLLSVARRFAESSTNNIPAVFSANSKIAVEVIEGVRSMDRKNKERRRKARILTELIDDLKIPYILPPFEEEGRRHVYYLYGLKVKERKKIAEGLRKIEKYTFWSLPWQSPQGHHARELSRQLVTFEMSPEPNERDVHLIASALSSASKQ